MDKKKLAFFGGEPVTNPIRYYPPLRPEDEQRVLDVLRSQNWGGFPFPNCTTQAFTEAFTKRLSCQYGLLVANGSVALSIALRALGIKAGDEVITTGFTFVASATSIVHINAVPVLVDIDRETFCIDPEKIEAAITEKTRAVVVVHLGNQLADMDRIMKIANKHNLRVVEDCANAHFACFRDRNVGTIGDAGTFSFQSSKIITSGEGGFMVCRDQAVWERAISLTNCGRKLPPYDTYEGQVLGWNYRATELQAAVLLSQLDTHDTIYPVRQACAHRLSKGLQELGFRAPISDSRVTTRQYYALLFHYNSACFAGVPRNRFLQVLQAEGIGFGGEDACPAIHRNPLFHVMAEEWPAIRPRYGEAINADVFSLSECDRAANETAVWIHHSLFSREQDVDLILQAVEKVRRCLEEI